MTMPNLCADIDDADVVIWEFTDPSCPWAYSAEPFRRRIDWLYGERIVWRTVMVGLSAAPEEMLEKGVTPAVQAAGLRRIARDHGMPIDTTERPRMAASIPACRLVIAARLHAARARALRPAPAARALRLRRPARRAADPARRRARRRRRGPRGTAAARRRRRRERRARGGHGPRARAAPGRPRARRQARQLVGRAALHLPLLRDLPRRGRGADRDPRLPAVRRLRRACSRTSCPDTGRREPPASVADVLAWTGTELATREVAVLCDIEHDEARERLGHVADERHVGFDGFWTLPRVLSVRRAASAASASGRSRSDPSSASAPARSSAPNGPVGTATTCTPSARAQAMSRGVSPMTTVRSRGHGASPFHARPARARATGGRSARSGESEPNPPWPASKWRPMPGGAQLQPRDRPRRCRSRARAA